METMNMDYDGNDETQQLSADTLPFARSYQLEALEKALKQNTIVFLETGSGKTLIAIMLLRSYAYLLRKPSRNLAIFVVPQVVLVAQQAEAVKMHTDLKVGMYWGDMGVDYWDEDRWKKEQGEHEVLVMTPAILLDGLRHCFFKLDMIKVLIFDECHHATGKHPYACIMTEFYHRQLHSDSSNLPKIFGMTASPVNSKGSNSASDYWQKIQNLENILNSKVYTCVNESVLAEFIPFSDTKIKIYKHVDIPYTLFKPLADDLKILKEKHQLAAKNLELKGSVGKKISKLYSVYLFCLNDLGVWLALRAAEFLSVCQTDIFLWGNLDIFGETIIKDFSKDVFKVFSTYIPSGSELSISDNLKANMDEGFLTSKVLCLIECLLEYRHVKDLRCIIFVERVITSIVLQILLDKVLPKQCGWNAKYIAGRNSGLQSQTRKDHNELVKEFRKGTVNVIVATSILEEGLDVQSCNLVIRFDPSANVCSFIQSRGRARMQNSDFVVMVRSGDSTTFSRVQNYLSSGDVMREESLRHAALPCEPLERDLSDEEVYLVESTGAIVTLSSSIALIYFYCSRLPSDGYFKPHPTCNIDKESGLCTLTLPKSCPIPPICAQGDVKMLKKIACLEACKKLHEIGELTDNLVPKIVVEAADSNDFEYDDKQLSYFPPELVNQCQNSSKTVHHCYLIELKPNFAQEIEVHDIVLAVRTKFDSDVLTTDFDLEVDGGSLTVRIKYVGELDLTPEKVLLCRMFQFVLLKVLIDHDLDKVEDIINGLHRGNDLIVDYLLLPSTILHQRPLMIDWNSISSVLFSCNNGLMGHKICYPSRVSAHGVQTKDGLVCSCMLENAVVCTPHNGRLYYISGFIDDLDGRSLLCSKNEGAITYKEYFESRHGIELRFEQQTLLFARRIFRVQNQLQSGRQWMEKVEKEKELRKTFVELPPELCSIIMSPLSIRTLYSFLFVPSIMHRIESLLLATNLKKMHSDHCKQNGSIPTIKVLEAITTKKCQEAFHLESLETLGDSFLKYAACQQLFKTYQNHHEGLLTAKKDKIISNAALCKFGCERKIPGFICDEFFDPKTWVIPGVQSGNCILKEELLSTTRSMYVRGKMKLKGKRVADVVEALIGAYLSTGGETSALLFLDWLGIEVDFVHKPYERIFQVQPERLVNVRHLENLLNYSFRDPSLLVEALTHGSYMLPEISRSYQRLEFLGDSVLDYVITKHLYYKYPGLSPGLLTELRSASVNNDCYAQCTVRAELYKHILHLSPKLHKHIVETVENFKQMSLELTFGWESESSFPKVLGDVIESLAGAILVDSGYNEEVVFNSIRPLLEPIVTPETVRYHPAKEINEFCQKKHYTLIKTVHRDNGRASYTVEVEADGVMHEYTCFDNDKRTAKKVACKNVLKSLKEAISEQEQPESTSS